LAVAGLWTGERPRRKKSKPSHSEKRTRNRYREGKVRRLQDGAGKPKGFKRKENKLNSSPKGEGGCRPVTHPKKKPNKKPNKKKIGHYSDAGPQHESGRESGGDAGKGREERQGLGNPTLPSTECKTEKKKNLKTEKILGGHQKKKTGCASKKGQKQRQVAKSPKTRQSEKIKKTRLKKRIPRKLSKKHPRGKKKWASSGRALKHKRLERSTQTSERQNQKPLKCTKRKVRRPAKTRVQAPKKRTHNRTKQGKNHPSLGIESWVHVRRGRGYGGTKGRQGEQNPPKTSKETTKTERFTGREKYLSSNPPTKLSQKKTRYLQQREKKKKRHGEQTVPAVQGGRGSPKVKTTTNWGEKKKPPQNETRKLKEQKFQTGNMGGPDLITGP